MVDIIEIVTVIGFFVGVVVLWVMIMQWYRARSYRVSASAKLPFVLFDKEGFLLEVTVVNMGERQFSIDSIEIWLHTGTSFGQVFDVSLTEIASAKLEDGDKLKKTIDISRYLIGVSNMRKRKDITSKRVHKNWVEIFFTTTTGKKVALRLPDDVKRTILEYIDCH